MRARILHLASLATLLSAQGALADPPKVSDPLDRQILDAFLGHVENSARECTPERMAKFAEQPEDITWQGSRYIRMALVAYRLTEDTKYLDAFVARMDTLCGCMTKGPDGFMGWYGLPYPIFRHPDHPDQKVDVMLTDFVVAGLMAEFAQVVQGSGALKAKYAEPAQRYLKLAEEQLVPKWERRGRFRDFGRNGAVYITHADLKPVKASLTQPHNKHSKIIQALLALYLATGKDEYLIKAIRLGTRFKHCLTLAGDHYRWDYWDPSGAWDVDPANPAKWKHWIGPEHTGGYYASTLAQAVILYEYGLVFDKTDMERFARTQTSVCWNGDTAAPKWANVEYRAAKEPYLCAWLAPFDRRIYEMACGGPAQQARLAGRVHPWQGGPVACEWLEFKLLDYPSLKGGEPARRDAVARFLAKPDNRALVDALAFEVKAPGYLPPMAPAQMKPMPGAKQ